MSDRDAAHYLEEREVLWRWVVPPDHCQPRDIAPDIADEYAIVRCPVQPGVMTLARYGERWVANPWSTRPVIAELLRRLNDNATTQGTA